MPDLNLEKSFETSLICGVDEAGRGPLCGPVVAAAVILDIENIPEGINDSKKLSDKKREVIFSQIMQTSQVGIGHAEAAEIDEINILQATKKAMSKAVEQLKTSVEVVLVDGNQKFELPFEAKVIPVVKGDLKSLSIAAASIIAKVTRDRIMKNLHEIHPEYNWAKNSGYGTKEHLQAIEKYGITEHHRKSFAPIKNMV